MFEFLRTWRAARRESGPAIPEELWARVEAWLPFLDYLQASERARLRELACAFLREKQFHGAQGFELSDEMMLAIALQACLPILNIGLEAYRGWVGIVVYPGDFVIPRQEVDEDGVVHEFDDEVLGEAWEQGPVLVSWYDDAGAPGGANVVIHEFAHKLDMSNGGADGLPPLAPGMSRARWANVFGEAYETLCGQIDADEPTALDPYAAENPAEFFAVASEAFFETPCALQRAFPEVYEQLRGLYRLNPAAGERRVDGQPGRPYRIHR